MMKSLIAFHFCCEAAGNYEKEFFPIFKDPTYQKRIVG